MVLDKLPIYVPSPTPLLTSGCTGLQVNEGGLTSDEHAKRLEEYGPNKLPESTRNPILVYLGYMWNPLSWAMECAVILAVALLDYADFCLIIALLLTNATISYVEVGSLPAASRLPLVQLSSMSGLSGALLAAPPASAGSGSCLSAECSIAQAQPGDLQHCLSIHSHNLPAACYTGVQR